MLRRFADMVATRHAATVRSSRINVDYRPTPSDDAHAILANMKYGAYQRGFALPTVLLASIVMMVVLMTALVAANGGRSMLERQHYDRLAKEVAESGLTVAKDCLIKNGMAATWSNAKPLRPDTNCSGDVVSGRSSHVHQWDNHRSAFSVGIDTTADGVYTISSRGIIERVRASGGAAWQTYDHTLKADTSSTAAVAAQVSSGLFQVCAILSGHTWCNGGNQNGQMGNGRVEPLPPATGSALYLIPERVSRQPGLLAGRQDKIVASGQMRACTVTTDNEIFCWGESGYGVLGTGGSVPNPQPLPVRVAKPASMTGDISAIAIGWQAACVISGGDLWCWGRNHHGQLGIGSATPSQSSTPVRAQNIGSHVGKTVTDITSHPYADSFCAVAGGEAYCWGRNHYGQLGNNTTSTQLAPTAVTKQADGLSGKTVEKIIHATAPRAHDAQIHLPDGTGGSCTPENRGCYSQSYSCALTTDGQMYCWGANRYGQMGQGTWETDNQLVPIRIKGALDGKFVRDIAGSYRTPCALTTEPNSMDRLYCWGGNQSGAGGLGHNVACDTTTAWRRTLCSPAPVVMETPGLKDKYIDSISAGVNRMCAIAEGSHYCTGANTEGQIGDGTTKLRLVPTEVTVLGKRLPTRAY